MKETYTSPSATCWEIHLESQLLQGSNKFKAAGQGDFSGYGVTDYEEEDWG